MDDDARREAGVAMRRAVHGDEHVDRMTAEADGFTRDYQDLLTRYAWGEIWTRPGLDRRTRSIITVSLLAALGHQEELALHLRGARRNGVSPQELVEVLLQVGVYAGIPAANSAFRIAGPVLREPDPRRTSS